MAVFEYKNSTSCIMCRNTQSKTLGLRLNQSTGFFPRKKNGLAVTVVKCKKCRLIYTNPLPIPTSVEENYDMEVEEYWGHVDKLEDLDNQQEAISIFRKLYGTTSLNGLSALDIGSGIGQTMIALRKHGFNVFGLEPAPKFYEKAKEWGGFEDSQLQLNTLEGAAYPENSFDYISFLNVLEHVYDPNDALKKTTKWLKPGGLMYVCVPYSGWLTGKILNLYYRLIGTSFVTNTSPMHIPFHLYEFSKKSFMENAKVNGYEVVSLQVRKSMPVNKFDALLMPLQALTGTGLRLDVWIKKTT